MRLVALIFSTIALLMPFTSKAEGPKTMYRLQPTGDYRSISIENEGSRSHFSGFSSGFSIEMISPSTHTRKSLLMGFESVDLKNSANSNERKEILKGQTYFVGTRFYTNYLFIGVRLLAGQRELNIQLPTGNTSRTFLDYGLGGEIGTDLRLGAGFFLTPSLHYRIGHLEPKSSGSATKTTSDFLVSASLGFEF